MSKFYGITIQQERGLAVGIYSGDKRLRQYISWESAGRVVDRLFKYNKIDKRLYEIWYPSWSAQGNLNNPAVKIGEILAFTFQEACDRIVPNSPYKDSYDPLMLSVWAGDLCDNEKEANHG